MAQAHSDYATGNYPQSPDIYQAGVALDLSPLPSRDSTNNNAVRFSLDVHRDNPSDESAQSTPSRSDFHAKRSLREKAMDWIFKDITDMRPQEDDRADDEHVVEEIQAEAPFVAFANAQPETGTSDDDLAEEDPPANGQARDPDHEIAVALASLVSVPRWQGYPGLLGAPYSEHRISSSTCLDLKQFDGRRKRLLFWHLDLLDLSYLARGDSSNMGAFKLLQSRSRLSCFRNEQITRRRIFQALYRLRKDL